MKKGFKSGLLIFIILLLITGGISAYCIFSSRNSPNTAKLPENGNPSGITFSVKSANSSNTKVTASNSKQYVAALYVEGTIEEANTTYNQKWLLSTISALANDTNNVAIALYINSPGGAVYQADEVYLALEAYRKLGKPIYCYMGATAASGGYYIACAGNKIYANRNTLTGSIGVISGQVLDATDMMDKIGLKSETIHAGRNKNMGNFNEPISDEQRAILQGIADECYDQFTGIVADDRKIPLDKVKELADGRIYTAKQAKENKLIDEICTYETMLNEIKTAILEKPDIKVVDYKYQKEINLTNFLSRAEYDFATSQAAANLGLPLKVVEQMNSTVSYPAYLYEN